MVTVLLSLFPGAFSGGMHRVQTYTLASTAGLKAEGGTLVSADYRGRASVMLEEDPKSPLGAFADIPNLDFGNGTIDFDIAGMPSDHAADDVRGFVGIAFHLSEDHQRFENFYLRVTNGRAIDPVRRKHAVQYCSLPDHPWNELRKNHPLKYEAACDLEVGAWTHVHIEVSGSRAAFFVNNAPCLTVRGLFLGPTHGKVALWVGDQSRAYFANLKVHDS